MCMGTCIARDKIEDRRFKYYVLGWLPIAGAVLYNNRSYPTRLRHNMRMDALEYRRFKYKSLL